MKSDGGLRGDADCHSQCAHWLRNDTLYEMRYESGRSTARVAPTKSVVGADAPVRPWAFLGCVMRRGEGTPPYIILCYFVVRGGGAASGLSPVNRAGERPALWVEFSFLTYSDRRSSQR